MGRCKRQIVTQQISKATCLRAGGFAVVPSNQDFLTQGNKHISFGVPNAHILLDEFKQLGVNIAFVAEVNGTYGVFINDNTGNLIEILEEGYLR